jgi:hypothetical protein
MLRSLAASQLFSCSNVSLHLHQNIPGTYHLPFFMNCVVLGGPLLEIALFYFVFS